MSHLTKSEKRFVNQLAHAHAQIYEIQARDNLKARLQKLKSQGVVSEKAFEELQTMAPKAALVETSSGQVVCSRTVSEI